MTDRIDPTPKTDAARRRDWAKQDAEVADISRTVQPKSDAPSRSGIGGEGSGADTQGTQAKPTRRSPGTDR